MSVPAKDLAEWFNLDTMPELRPRYNVAPAQPILGVRSLAGAGKREAALLRWGLIPHWSRDPKDAFKHINARAETVAEKPAYRDPFRKRRCLIPASGFYEWAPAGKHKQPYAFRLTDGRPFAFAGLWDLWEGAGGELIESATIITTEANELVRPVHGRMPAILPHEAYDAWLDPNNRDKAGLLNLLRPYPVEGMVAFAVSPWVSNARNEGPRCLEPVAGGQPGLF